MAELIELHYCHSGNSRFIVGPIVYVNKVIQLSPKNTSISPRNVVQNYFLRFCATVRRVSQLLSASFNGCRFITLLITRGRGGERRAVPLRQLRLLRPMSHLQFYRAILSHNFIAR